MPDKGKLRLEGRKDYDDHVADDNDDDKNNNLLTDMPADSSEIVELGSNPGAEWVNVNMAILCHVVDAFKRHGNKSVTETNNSRTTVNISCL